MGGHVLFQTVLHFGLFGLAGVGPESADSPGGAAEVEHSEGEQQVSPAALHAWLAAADPGHKPPPGEQPADETQRAPRRHGIVCEAALGATGHTGGMSKVSPSAPLLRLGLGYEVTNWLLLGTFADLSLTDTRYASRQLDSRAYTLGAVGVGLRLSWSLLPSLSLTAQGDVGLAKTDEPVLRPLGYRRADQLGLQLSAIGGVEWYQTSPHHAVRFFGGMRQFQRNFRRLQSNSSARAWLGGIGLRYAL